MKLLIENWRKFLKEDEGDHFPWLEQLKNNPEKFIRDQQEKGTGGGAGSYRVVVVPDSDPDYVVKIAKQEDKLFTNKIEKILGDEYPEVFPRVYASAPDFKWIVADRCVPINIRNKQLVEEALVATMPKFYEFARQAYSEQYNDSNPDAYDVLMYILGIKFYKFSPEGSTERKVYDFGLANEPWYRQFAKAVKRYGIQTGDIRYNNIGIDMKTHTLKIIDASVFVADAGEKKWN
jgi:hypothetical protein